MKYPQKLALIKVYQDDNELDSRLTSPFPDLPGSRPRIRPASLSQKRRNFPECNATMSALMLGTIIVEAGERSGTHHEARATLHQERKLFILDSCFGNPDIVCPQRDERLGAIRVRELRDIWVNLDF